ncbi:MAG: YciI family protein [Bryobacter sp.]|nr:YciI family protein [Bryobacter sp.]
MKYAVMVYETAQDFAQRNNEEAPAYWAAYSAYGAALREAGVAAGGQALQGPSTATTLRIEGGKRHVQDGPYAETKEQLGGFFLIEVPDLDAALEWAARCPAATRGAVEVRPILPMQ